MVKLGDAARFINGAAFKPADWADDGLPIIRIQNLTGTGDSFNRTNRVVRKELIVEPGDLLVSWSATLDAYRWAGPKGVLNQHIFKVLPNDGVDQGYLYYALKEAIAELERKTHGSTMKHVVRGDFEGTRIPLPPLPEQRRIVDLLSRADNIVRMRKEAEAKAKEIIPALFLDMFGDPATNPRGGRQADCASADGHRGPVKAVTGFPANRKEWCTVTLGNSTDIQGGLQVTTKRAGLPIEVPYLRVANVHRTHLDLSEIKTIRATDAELARTRLFPGDLLVIEGHGNPAEVGRVGMWPGGIDPCVHQNHLIRVRCRPDSFSPIYVWAYLNSNIGRQKLLRQGKTTSGLNTISVSNVKSVVVPQPPIQLQQDFASRVSDVTTLHSSQRSATEHAAQAFESLLAGVFG